MAGAIGELQLLHDRWGAIAPAKARHLGVSLAEAARWSRLATFQRTVGASVIAQRRIGEMS
jgi:hypothetical protein